MPAKIFAIGLVLALGACDNRDEDLEREVRGLCDQIVLGTTTLRQAAQLMGDLPVFITCRDDFEALANQVCPAEASVCQLRYQFLSNDCGPGGCTFVCDVRTQDVASGGPPSLDTPICASRFITQQPFVFN